MTDHVLHFYDSHQIRSRALTYSQQIPHKKNAAETIYLASLAGGTPMPLVLR